MLINRCLRLEARRNLFAVFLRRFQTGKPFETFGCLTVRQYCRQLHAGLFFFIIIPAALSLSFFFFCCLSHKQTHHVAQFH